MKRFMIVTQDYTAAYVSDYREYALGQATDGLVAFESIRAFNESESRADFESMAAVCYPGALSAGRDEVWGTYINSNLEKRWKGWKACEEFRAGIVPTQQRGKS